MAKARPEETDQGTAKDVVENGERLEAPVAFNSLISGFSTWWILTAQSPQAVVYSTVCLLLQDWDFWCFLPFLYSEASQKRPEESGCVSLSLGLEEEGTAWFCSGYSMWVLLQAPPLSWM